MNTYILHMKIKIDTILEKDGRACFIFPSAQPSALFFVLLYDMYLTLHNFQKWRYKLGKTQGRI